MSATPLPRAPDVQRIDVRGLSKSFQLAGTAIEAVRDVSFRVRRGEFVALLGPSGSGKSTILNMIATLIKPSSGQILIDGMPVVSGKATPNVGYVFQRDTLFPWRTVADNIGYGLQLAGVGDAERKERVAACVAQAGLLGFEQAYPSALSGGMRQRAALMRTLVVEPQILLMDEPFGALDTHTKIDMHEVLLRIWEREQQTVLFVTHDLGEALTLADRIILFSARPGMIKDMFGVDFARRRGTPSYSSTSGTRSAKNSSRDTAHEDPAAHQHTCMAGADLCRCAFDLAMGICFACQRSLAGA